MNRKFGIVLALTVIHSLSAWAQQPSIELLRTALAGCRKADQQWRDSTGTKNLPAFEQFFLRDGDPRSLGASFTSLEELSKKESWNDADKSAAKGFAAQFSKSANDLVNNLKLLNNRSRSGNGDKDREFPRNLIQSGLIRDIQTAVDGIATGTTFTKSTPTKVTVPETPLPNTEAATKLVQLRSDFQAEEKLLDSPLANLVSKYREYLVTQKNSYQQGGNLRGVLAAEEELKNFNGSPPGNLSPFPEIKRLQEIYKTQHGEILENRKAAWLNLIGKYQKKAEDISLESTKAGRIDEATIALAEAERYAAMQSESPVVSPSPSTKPGPKPDDAPARTTNFQGMILDPAWMPERLGVAHRHTGELRYYSKRVLEGETPGKETAPDLLWGNLKWLMPIDKAIESFGRVTKKPSIKIVHQWYPHNSFTLHGLQGRFQDGNYLFSEVFLLADAKGQLISVQFVAHAPKVMAWIPGYPVEVKGPCYDFVNIKTNASTGNMVSFQMVPLRPGLKVIKLVLHKPPPFGKWLEDSHWYIPAPLAGRFIEIADKVLGASADPNPLTSTTPIPNLPVMQDQRGLMETYAGMWTIRIGRYQASRTLFPDGSVRGEDGKMHRWVIENNQLSIRYGTKLWETYTLPPDSSGVLRGKTQAGKDTTLSR